MHARMRWDTEAVETSRAILEDVSVHVYWFGAVQEFEDAPPELLSDSLGVVFSCFHACSQVFQVYVPFWCGTSTVIVSI